MLAVILADGSIDFGQRYTTTFTEQPEVVERLVKEFSSIDGRKIDWKTDRLHNSLRARAYGKELADLIGTLVGTTRTRKFETYPKSPKGKIGYPEIALPNRIFTDSKVASEFLKYYSTCDGGPEFRVYRRASGSIQIGSGIKIGCLNPSIRSQLKSLFKSLGIRVSVRTDGLEVLSLEALEKFRDRVGFLEESKVRRGKLLRGVPKNDVVELMILCRRISKEQQWMNRNFAEIEPFEGFLQECSRSIRDARRLRGIFLRIGVDLSKFRAHWA